MIQTLKNTSWLIILALSVFLFYITSEYLSFQPDVNFLLVKENIVFDPIWRPTFYIHVISGMAVILVGPLQFLPQLRKKSIKLHKQLGKIYAYGILLFAAPTGLIMAFYAEGGLSSTIAFLVMGVLWFLTTILAIYFVRKGNILAHQKWMYRSFALSFAAVTLRILVPLFSLTTELTELEIIVSTAWLSWIINLLLVEIYLILTFKFSLKKQTL
ncbi:MAG: DUF2306 domain-containing protein [Crocinitomicaceae bacterium]